MSDDPTTYSLAQETQRDAWQTIRDVRAGTRTMRAKAKDRKYLPKFSDEDDTTYANRVETTPFDAHYEDATRALIAKPFSKPVSLAGSGDEDEAPIDEAAVTWADDFDLAGNNLHVWAHKAFEEAVHMGGVLAFVDYPRITTPLRNRAEQRAANLRPYVRLIPIDDVYAVRDAVIGGRREIVLLRFRDDYVRPVGPFGETTVQRVRQYRRDDGTGAILVETYEFAEGEWHLNAGETGTLDGISRIPVAPYIIGRVEDDRYASRPTMLDVAEKQIEHFRHSGRIVGTFDASAFPMLQAEGMAPERDPEGNIKPVKVGPRRVLYSGITRGADVRPGRWSYVEPSCASLAQAIDYLDRIEDSIRSMALQPTLPSENVVNQAATTSAINAARAHSVLQAWSLHLKDWLEQIFVLMKEWEGQASDVVVQVVTDFSDTAFTVEHLKVLQEARAVGDISRRTFWDELKRRGVLGDGFAPNDEEDRIETEGGGLIGHNGGPPIDDGTGDRTGGGTGDDGTIRPPVGAAA